ncbi:uncharacterized protein LOC111037119 [Myzus persicae]|uniref:uncharacterized protein LOC111037119 n=1 Tax=Myzus persicae TaxID=13164 RepID=UPI000B936434|nr:uncharacterized protein LOC111037119 [Myzus persicae]
MNSLKNNKRFGCNKIIPGWSLSPKKIKNKSQQHVNLVRNKSSSDKQLVFDEQTNDQQLNTPLKQTTYLSQMEKSMNEHNSTSKLFEISKDIENDHHENMMTSLKNNKRIDCNKINPGWSPSPKKIKISQMEKTNNRHNSAQTSASKQFEISKDTTECLNQILT